jgi:kynureninase
MMDYQNNLNFALQLDSNDALNNFREQFLIPHHNGKEAVYLCGNSLGLQPVSAQKYLAEQMSVWQQHGVEGWFAGDAPWLSYHKQVAATVAEVVGAKHTEVAVMNSLTVNLHLLMVSFYKPTTKRYKIIMEGGAFPSDQYAMESQVRFHGFDPKDAIIELFPREGEYTLRTSDILKKINENADKLSLVMFAGINYFTGQLFDMAAIANAAHNIGAYVGFDLAHAAGNVQLKLHDWNADFACWCSYKYLNSGPGGISGIFVHEKHFDNKELSRFAGWWGYREDKRFLMTPGFEPALGAEGWQVSTSPILLLALHKASLDVFNKAGGIDELRKKSELLTGYLEFLINDINLKAGNEIYTIITPKNKAERGCQLSIICRQNARATFNYLTSNGVIGDWREPNVIRLSPVPLYNTFNDVFMAAEYLRSAVKEIA